VGILAGVTAARALIVGVPTVTGPTAVSEFPIADDEVAMYVVVLVEGVYVKDATLPLAVVRHYLLPGVIERRTLCSVARWRFR
jgi:hypothetical protein